MAQSSGQAPSQHIMHQLQEMTGWSAIGVAHLHEQLKQTTSYGLLKLLPIRSGTAGSAHRSQRSTQTHTSPDAMFSSLCFKRRTRLGPDVPPLVTPGAARLGHPLAGCVQAQA